MIFQVFNRDNRRKRNHNYRNAFSIPTLTNDSKTSDHDSTVAPITAEPTVEQKTVEHGIQQEKKDMQLFPNVELQSSKNEIIDDVGTVPNDAGAMVDRDSFVELNNLPQQYKDLVSSACDQHKQSPLQQHITTAEITKTDPILKLKSHSKKLKRKKYQIKLNEKQIRAIYESLKKSNAINQNARGDKNSGSKFFILYPMLANVAVTFLVNNLVSFFTDQYSSI